MKNYDELSRLESIRRSANEFIKAIGAAGIQGRQLIYELRRLILIALIGYGAYRLWNQPTPSSVVTTKLHYGEIAELPYRNVTIHDASGRQLYPTGIY